ncbi:MULTISPECIES: LysM peptidoglycan-binding domain-containing protein [unclassified Nonomuraea]|uniref:LysM peptidoglycan-binding domain-containing protein n=1 Tax=unclassified Nonomuraea TaxID=2593643 RepID=UPI0033E49720
MTMLRLLRAVAAFVVLLSGVVGFPVLFCKIVGSPVPDHLPSLREVAEVLSAPADGTLFVAGLEVVAWGAWAAFTVSVLVEVIAKLRGRRAVPRLAGLQGMQRVVAYLVASATLAVLTPGVSSAAAPPDVIAVATAHPLGQAVTPDVESPPRERIYRVKEGDSLWGIADEELGSPRRWPKIWKANAGSRQPHGRTFTNPGVIHPGWKLRIPLKRSEISRAVPPRQQPPAAEPTLAKPSITPFQQRESDDVVQLSSGSLVALSYAAGISTAYIAGRLHRRRRRVPPTSDEPVVISPEPEPPAPVLELHRAHRRAFAQRAEPIPADGELIQQEHSIDVPDQIHLGQRGDGSPLRVALEGPGFGLTGAGADDVVRYLIVDLLRQSSNYRVQIIICSALVEKLFGLSGKEVEQIGAALPGLLLAASHEDALRQFEEMYFMRMRMVLERESTDIGEVRRNDPGEALPATLLIAELDDEVYEHATAPLTAGRRAGVGGLFLGSWPEGITCDIGETHRVEGGGNDSLMDALMFHINKDEAAAHLRQLIPDKEDSPAPAPATGEEPCDWPASTPVRLTVLGHPAVHVRGRSEALTLSWLQLSTLTYLALHPNGVTRDQLATALWPDDLGKDIHNALRHLRGALVAATGHKSVEAKRAPFISASTTKDSAVYRIDRDLISVDLWDYEKALERIRSAVEPADRLVALTKAAELCTGELAEGLTAEWIEDQRYPLTRSQADVLAQLAEHLTDVDAEGALAALERARQLDPDTEETYFRIIRLQLRLDRRDDASRTAELLRQHQRSLGVPGDYRTEKRLSEVLHR